MVGVEQCPHPSGDRVCSLSSGGDPHTLPAPRDLRFDMGMRLIRVFWLWDVHSPAEPCLLLWP